MSINCQYNSGTVSKNSYKGSLGDITSPFIQVSVDFLSLYLIAIVSIYSDTNAI